MDQWNIEVSKNLSKTYTNELDIEKGKNIR